MTAPVAVAFAAALAAGLIVLHPTAQAAGPYAVAFLQPAAGFGSAAGFSIQANGDVVGYMATAGPTPSLQAVIWRNGVPTLIGPGLAVDSNAAGLVVGQTGSGQSWTWAAAQPSVPITPLTPLPGDDQTRANAVNDAGTVVGSSNAAGGYFRPVRWDGGTPTPLVTGGSPDGFASDINASGQIAGAAYFGGTSSRPVLWTQQQLVPLDTLGGDQGEALAINDLGIAVGRSSREGLGPQHATWWNGTQAVALGTQGFSSEAYGVNNHGQAVGLNLTGMGQGGRQFGVLWEEGEMFDLNDFLGRHSANWTVTLARDINDQGQILALARGPGGTGATVIFTPVPEPASWALWLLGLTAAVAKARSGQPRKRGVT